MNTWLFKTHGVRLLCPGSSPPQLSARTSVSVTTLPVCIRMHVRSSCVPIKYHVLEILRSLLTDALRVQVQSTFA